MNEVKFNSQICTSVEQSKRLLELGLKPETADMVLFKSYDLPQYPFDYTFNQDPNALVNRSYVPTVKGNQPYIQDGNIPAWSLHRLIEIVNLKIQFRLKEKTTVIYGISDSQPFQSFSGFGIDGKSYYNSVINAIEWLIKEGYFNKEYLKQ